MNNQQMRPKLSGELMAEQQLEIAMRENACMAEVVAILEKYQCDMVPTYFFEPNGYKAMVNFKARAPRVKVPTGQN